MATFSELRLPAHSFAALRVDGENFTRFTKDLRKDSPFHEGFNERMLAVGRELIKQVDGAFAVYVGSDEASVLLHDLAPKSEKWCGGRVEKMASLSASVATAAFNHGHDSLALFDGRSA